MNEDLKDLTDEEIQIVSVFRKQKIDKEKEERQKFLAIKIFFKMMKKNKGIVYSEFRKYYLLDEESSKVFHFVERVYKSLW